MKCPNCKSENLSPEYYAGAIIVRNCNACHHENPATSFHVETKRNEAVASEFKAPASVDLISAMKTQSEVNERLSRQLEAAINSAHKREQENIGLKKQVVDLLVCISKLKAIKKELRNIIDCQAREIK